MSSTNKTPNLGLCQWVETDPFLREDMNGDFAKIDEAIGKMSRVKLFDVTVTEAVQSIRLDFLELDMDQFASLEIQMDIKEGNTRMRINGISDYSYMCVSTIGSNNSAAISLRPGTTNLDISKAFYVIRCIYDLSVYSLKRNLAPTLTELYIFEDYSGSFRVGDRITVWGVKR